MAVPQKIKSRITIWSSNSFLDLYPKELKAETPRDVTPIFIALFTIAKTRKQPKSPFIKKNRSAKQVYMQWNTVQPLKEGNSDLSYNADETYGDNAKWKRKAGFKKTNTVQFYLFETLSQNNRYRKQMMVAGAWVGEERLEGSVQWACSFSFTTWEELWRPMVAMASKL